MTSKDIQRIETLIDYAKDKGLSPAIDKAVRDADKIGTLDKCRDRALLLEQRGFKALGVPFRNRALVLEASGVR